MNFLDDLPIIRDEVLPRLERLGYTCAASEQRSTTVRP
jgi:hypothetical protein